MTPQRAKEIWREALAGDDAPLLFDPVAAILAACREERHAALTEAAQACGAERIIPVTGTDDHPFNAGCTAAKLAVLALRDQPRRSK